jgi:hypothetical protein
LYRHGRYNGYLNSSCNGSPLDALGNGTLHSTERVMAISLVLTLRVTDALLAVQPNQISGT